MVTIVPIITVLSNTDRTAADRKTADRAKALTNCIGVTTRRYRPIRSQVGIPKAKAKVGVKVQPQFVARVAVASFAAPIPSAASCKEAARRLLIAIVTAATTIIPRDYPKGAELGGGWG